MRSSSRERETKSGQKEKMKEGSSILSGENELHVLIKIYITTRPRQY